MKKDKNIELAIKLFGNQKNLADEMNVGQGHISQWLNSKKKPSPCNAVKLNKITEGEILASSYYPYLTDI